MNDWYALTGDESSGEVYKRLRDNPPRVVLVPTKGALEGFMQAWNRAARPDVILIVKPDLVEG